MKCDHPSVLLSPRNRLLQQSPARTPADVPESRPLKAAVADTSFSATVFSKNRFSVTQFSIIRTSAALAAGFVILGAGLCFGAATAAAEPTKKNYKEYVMESDEALRQRLSKEQYHVVRENGTERPFANEYWDHKQDGIYVDVVSGEPLFSSTTKFESGTGWPSFYEPLVAENVVEVADTSHGMRRVEVRSKRGDSHLGHLFPDGPKPTGQRYCINSAALRFIPVAELEAAGYGEYLSLFSKAAK